MQKILTALILLQSLALKAQTDTDTTLLEYCRSRNAEAKIYYNSGEYGLAVEYFRELAGIGYPPAMTNMGIASLNGTGTIQDSEKALYYFSKAAELGEPTAQIHLGTMFARGIGTAMNDSAAIHWLSKAAGRGSTAAMNTIGSIYLNGNTIQADSIEACRWFRQAALAGDLDGLHYFGTTLMSIAPLYSDTTFGSGRYCVYKAARMGHRESQIYLMNDAAEQSNYAAAVQWAQQLYDSGDYSGIMLLADCYRHGTGVAKNKRRAKRLYTQAAEAGNEEAARILEEW